MRGFLKKKDCWFVMGLFLLSIVLISPCHAKIKIAVGHLYEVANPVHKGALLFKDCVDYLSEGALVAEVYPAEQLGPDKAQMENVKIGTQQMAVTSSGMLSNIYKPAAALAMPYVFRDAEHYLKVVDGAVGKALQESIRKDTGLRPLTVLYQAPRHLTTKFPVKHVNDIKGLKLRVPEAPAWMEMARALGTKPTPVAWAELYTSLKLGVVDAQENPFKYIWAGKIYEVLDYIILTGHMRHLEYIHISDKFFSNLKPEHQKIVEIGAEMWAKYTNSLVGYNEEFVLRKKLEEKGMKILEVDRTSFIEATKDVYKKVLDEEGQRWFERIRSVK